MRQLDNRFRKQVSKKLCISKKVPEFSGVIYHPISSHDILFQHVEDINNIIKTHFESNKNFDDCMRELKRGLNKHV